MKLKKQDEGGTYLFPDIMRDERLDWFEKTLLSIYRSYTEYGKDKCCHMTFEQLNERHFGGTVDKNKYHRAKRRLKELNLIVSNGIVTKSISEGGIKNDTGGIKNDTHNIQS